jgi:hypothetical protein
LEWRYHIPSEARTYLLIPAIEFFRSM